MDKAMSRLSHQSMRRSMRRSMPKSIAPTPTIDLLHRLKKEKLRLKDAIIGH